MDFKIVDLDYLMVFYAEEYNSGKADEEFRLADAAVISGILKEARKVDDVPPFVYPCGRRSDRMELQEDEWER